MAFPKRVRRVCRGDVGVMCATLRSYDPTFGGAVSFVRSDVRILVPCRSYDPTPLEVAPHPVVTSTMRLQVVAAATPCCNGIVFARDRRRFPSQIAQIASTSGPVGESTIQTLAFPLVF